MSSPLVHKNILTFMDPKYCGMLKNGHTMNTTGMDFPFSKLFHPLGQITNRWTMTQKEVELIAGGRIVR